MITTLLRVGALAASLALPIHSFAHCDSVAGPVAKDVKRALGSGQLAPVLKWIRAGDEPELRSVFERALSVRKASGEAALLADRYFLETAVRLHRASEGEPYTGLKPASTADEPIPSAVDQALKTDTVADVANSVLSDLRAEVSRRVEAVGHTYKDREKSAEQGREFVHAYVGLVHYLEALESSAKNQSAEDQHHHPQN